MLLVHAFLARYTLYTSRDTNSYVFAMRGRRKKRETATTCVMALLLVLRALLLASLLLPLLEAAPLSEKHGHASHTDGDDEWDHFVFMQQYPAGVCYHSNSTSHRHSSSGCSYPKNATTWTIHGLWPSYGSEKAPNFCQNISFNFTLIADMTSSLVAEWTNLENRTAFTSFWSHEWIKHGTCYTSSQRDYFSKVFNLFENGIAFGPILESCNITPSMTQDYQVDNFHNCIRNKLGAEPYLECTTVKGGKDVLMQMGVCLAKDNFQPIQCPSGSASSNSCSTSSAGVFYPPSMYHN